MRVFQRAVLICLMSCLTACISHLNYHEGIASFHAGDYRKAFIELKPEAEKGQPDAQYAVGYMYYYGQGVVEDRKRAMMWISRAAAAGQPEAVKAMSMLVK